MNYSIIKYILGWVLKFEALFMMLPCLVAIIYREKSGGAYFIVAVICLILGVVIGDKKKNSLFYAREGFVMVALSWIVLSVFGALPFVISGEIPNFTNALFETTSGFTTTGASILEDVEELSHTALFWRSFTHWIGGMGVLVFILAVLPMAGGQSIHLMRTESPGPSVSKLVPRLRDTAFILYAIYFAMTVLEILLLIIAGMPVFDSITTAMGTAGTGGFGIKADSIGGYSILVQAIVTVFMILFGINFNAYYFLLCRKVKDAFKMEEVRVYLMIIAVCILMITINISGQFESIFYAFHHAAFQVASIITTTGFGTIDFDLWPTFSKSILVLLMLVGACAGSTGGGIKVSRIIIMFKNVKNEMLSYIHPRTIKAIRINNHVVDKDTLSHTTVFLATYILIFIGSIILIGLDNFDFTTNFTAVASALNNIGPGLNLVGPTRNFNLFSDFSKYILMFDMLAGRLELYPILLLLSHSTWKNK